ncbi:major facilitator superfamily domain-containing protein [Aspergillus candidus]|uniref:Major facilitator superfamily domain-containing protein n=1 Tax=Aspergillus candidus TaxID=41067 RepID=A0A2I2FJA0_ASPCN|nr:major facilitator superfamily domain-containing protein [Aspergillus candidus]PLB40699.1 major facilitator superfamily domain-containing protein [Aspergillus candidus]
MTPLPALSSFQSRVARVPAYIYARYLHLASVTRRKDSGKEDMGLEILHLGSGGGSRSRSSSGTHDDKKPVSQHTYREEIDDDALSAVDVCVSPAVAGYRTPDVKEYLVLTCVLAAAMMDGYNATVAIPLIPTLSTLLTTPLDNALWLSTSYLLANAAIQPLCALLFRTPTPTPSGIPLLTALTTSTVGTGICAGSANLPTLITGRIIQGLGSGAATALSLQLVERAISPPHRARFAGYVLRARGAGAVVGTVMGGLLGERRNWAAGFYFGLMFCAVALLVGPFGVELSHSSPSSSSSSIAAAVDHDDDDDDDDDLSTHIHLLSLYLGLIRTLTPTQTGLSLAALTITLTLPFCVDASQKHAQFALWAVRLGWALNVLLTGCFALLDEETPTAGWVFALLGAGLSHVQEYEPSQHTVCSSHGAHAPHSQFATRFLFV